MEPLAQTSLSELAITFPAASRVFHRHGLDYCCGGRRTLIEACETRELDPNAVLAEIRGEDRPRGVVDWTQRPLSELVDFIVARYHDDLRAELPLLVALAEKVEGRHAEKATCPRGLAAHLRAIHESVLVHLAKEEQVLFPLILEGRGRLAGGPVQTMEEDHREHGANLARTRTLTDDFTPPEEACPTWRSLYLRLEQLEIDLMEHIHLENNVLFPRALCEQ